MQQPQPPVHPPRYLTKRICLNEWLEDLNGQARVKFFYEMAIASLPAIRDENDPKFVLDVQTDKIYVEYSIVNHDYVVQVEEYERQNKKYTQQFQKWLDEQKTQIKL